MKTIHKYRLVGETNPLTLKLPQNARFLKVEMQNGAPCLWAIVDTTAPLVTYKFKVYGTGHEITEGDIALVYLATVFDKGFVWHIFQIFDETTRALSNVR